MPESKVVGSIRCRNKQPKVELKSIEVNYDYEDQVNSLLNKLSKIKDDNDR